MRYTDLMSLANDTTRKAEIRKRVGTCITTALVNEFGADFVRLLANDIYVGDTSSKIPSGSIIADVGDIVDKDKMTKGALIEVNIKVKQWNDTRTAKTDRQALVLDDIDEGIKIADELASKKREEANKRSANKAKKIQKDFEKRKKET